MSNTFETVRYTEDALKKLDRLLLEAFQRETGTKPDLVWSPMWQHRRVSWRELPRKECRARKDYIVEIKGDFTISTDRESMPSPWPHWQKKVKVRLVMLPAHRSRGWLTGRAAGIIKDEGIASITSIRYSFKKEIAAERKAMGLAP